MPVRSSPATMRLIVDGSDLGTWSEVDGIEASWGVVDYQPSHGSLADFLNKYAVMQGPISLRLVHRGTINPRLSMWHQQAARNPISARKNCVLELLGYDGKPVDRWTFVNAWPTKFAGPTIDSNTGRTRSDTVTITTDSIYRVRFRR